ncbi:MAG: sugar phosphate isomerase/epimerase [Fretibacterium sp.]|nr:sugar phosphate isomerase/epimerase [Fretibacterium sp.]
MAHKKQNFEEKDAQILKKFKELRDKHPERLKEPLKLSWSNWGFGLESLDDTCARLSGAGLSYIELHGNHYGPDLGYKADETLKTLKKYGMKVSGVCGMFSVHNDLSSNVAHQRQAAVDYLRRSIPFTAEVGGHYLLVVPGAVGRPVAYDATEFERSVATLRLVADLFVQHSVLAAVEPIRADEVSFVHTIAEAKEYIAAVDHPGVRHINGDLYHMQSGESHLGMAILEAGETLVNLHVADSNRRALGEGSMDLDTIIRALYLIGYNQGNRFVSAEPLGPGGDPYVAMNGKPNAKDLDELVQKTVSYFREREKIVLEA